MSRIDTAKSNLVFYIKRVWEGVGMKWDYLDNQGEVEEIVDAIIDAAVEKIKEELGEGK